VRRVSRGLWRGCTRSTGSTPKIASTAGTSVAQVPLHQNSRAVVFWKGRLVPYALVKELKYFEWPTQSDQDKDAQKRTVTLLFLSDVAQVDATKFNLKDDLEQELNDVK
jgi:hypothetical protein